jgi:hypothetical protein
MRQKPGSGPSANCEKRNLRPQTKGVQEDRDKPIHEPIRPVQPNPALKGIFDRFFTVFLCG